MLGFVMHPDTSIARTRLPLRAGFRPELQALRALAVAVVVIYHLWPAYLPGGYVGVDVFFAISGYLMTAHIVRGIMDNRGFTLRSFYVRRIRRLLPASLLVLLVVGVLTLIFSSPISWIETGKHIVSSAFYVENWALLLNSVDYLGAGSGTIPTQHFWSLSVEEQFYLVWPILLIAGLALARRRRWSPIATLSVAIAVVGVASLAYSVAATAFDQPTAYFNTLTRIWEFAAGGALALALPRLRIPHVLSLALTWLGLLVIAVSSLVYTDLSPFPGWIALVPVVATLAVITGGDEGGRGSAMPLLRWRPVQFLGDISYSVYLWHWPLIVLLPDILDRPVDGPAKVGILVASIILAWLSKKYVEDPFRADGGQGPGRVGRSGSHLPVFAAAAAGMVIVSLVGGAGWASAQGRVASAEASLAALPPIDTMACFGAPDLVGDCGSEPDLPDAVYPDPLIARQDTGSSGCQQSSTVADVLSCEFGNRESPALRVALAGDSHAGQWLAAMRGAADRGEWSLDTFLRSGCGLSVAAERGVGGQARCADWNADVLDRLVKGGYDLVVVSVRSSRVGGGSLTASEADAEAAAIGRAWEVLERAGISVVAIRDTPQPVSAGIFDLPECVDSATDAARECSFDEDTALVTDPQVEATQRIPATRLVDMSRYFCTDGVCPPVVGRALVYSDGHHITATYSESLAGFLGEEIDAALAE